MNTTRRFTAGLSLLLLVLLSTVQAYITFSDVNATRSITINTADYFQVPSPFQNMSNCIAVQVKPVPNTTDCHLEPTPSIPNYNMNGPFILNYTCTIAMVDLLGFEYAGCNNIYNLVAHIKQYWVPTNPDVDLPLKTVVLMIQPNVPNVTDSIAGPINTAYLSHSPMAGDGPPVLPTLFVALADMAIMSTTFKALGITEWKVNMTAQAGPWNAVFLSSGYIAYQWVMFGVLCAMIVFSLYRLFLATAQGTVKLDQRTAIFVGGLISSIMYAVAFTVRRETQLFFILDVIAQFIFSVAFYMLLMLWSGILQQVQKGKPLTPLRVAILLAFLIMVYNLVETIVWLSVWPTPGLDMAHEVARYLVPISQLIIGLLFLFYAIRFQLRKNSYNTSRDTRRALTKLSWLAILGFISFILKAIANFLVGDPNVYNSVTGVLICYVLADVAALLRAFAILMILGVRLPEQRSTTTSSTTHGGTSSSGTKTFLSWGGWSRGWRRALYGSSARYGDTTTGTMTQQSTSGLMSSTGYTGAKKPAKPATQRYSGISQMSGSSGDRTQKRSEVTPTTAVSLQASSGRQRNKRNSDF